MKMKSELLDKIKKIKLVITDVDGVLTDGGMYYGEKGEMMKKFNTRDGMGIELLKKNNIKIVFMTKENSKISFQRGKKLGVDQILLNIKNKELEIYKICTKYKIEKKNIAYIGDDVNDMEAMKKVGFSACPKDAEMEIRKISNFVCNKNGGDGALREFVNFILYHRRKTRN